MATLPRLGYADVGTAVKIKSLTHLADVGYPARMPTSRRATPEKLHAFATYLEQLPDVESVDKVAEPSLADLPDGFVLTCGGRRVQVYVTPEFWADIPRDRVASVLGAWRLAEAIAARDRLKVTAAGIEPPVVQCGGCRTSMQGSPYEPDPQYCVTCRPSTA
jgi:hypothetical protein